MTQFKKVTELKGTKTVNGRFTDMLYCPYCETHVESLMNHLKEKH